MKISNRDMFPATATIESFQDIEPLLDQPVFDDAFKAHDKAALKAKKLYHRFGQIAIMMIAFSGIFTIAEALLFPKLFNNIILTLFAATMAFSGLALQFYIMITRQKEKWLLNRYATEFIRSLKFQSFALADQASSSDDLRKLTQNFAAKRMANLENDLNAGLSILTEFLPAKVLTGSEKYFTEKTNHTAIGKTAGEAYHELRTVYQRNFALSEIEKFKTRRRLFNSTQDMIYMAAAIFALLALGGKILAYTGTVISTDWIDFTAVTLFILGATEAIMDNALLEEQSQARFEQYLRDLDVSDTADQLQLKDYILGTEHVCLSELGEFCRAAERIRYRF